MSLEQFLMGALDMIDAGIPPSKAVSCGASREQIDGIARLLKVGSLRELDRWDYDDLAGCLQNFALPLPPKRCKMVNDQAKSR